MNKIINDIKELPEFCKGLLLLAILIAYIFVPPLFVDGDYFTGMVGWIDVAFWGFLSALFLGCWIGKCAESESK